MRIDCHCHLGGCIPTSFVWETIQKFGLKHLAESEQDVIQQMTFNATEPRNFHRFLDKFRILDHIPWTEELIDESIQSVCDWLEKCNIDYVWMDFSINKYMKLGWHKHEAIRFIYDAFQRHRPNKVGLLLSLKYESTRASQRQYAQLIEHEVAKKCLIGIDLVGDEGYFDSEFYKPIFRDWNLASKITRTHTGESQSLDNVKESIINLQVTNIAHGFKIVNDKDLMKLANERNITFDLALTSNDLTGVWPLTTIHPVVKMLSYGLKATIGTDDPVICNVNLDHEYYVASKQGLLESELDMLRKTAYNNSSKFLTKI